MEDEMAPIPRAGEDLDAESIEKSLPAPPPPFSWTQSSDSVTVAFPIPSTTPKSSIKVSFSIKTLSLLIEDGVASELSSVRIPRYVMKPLWDTISPSTSFWTWDREGEKTFGLLTLHIDKANEGTKWVQLFQSIARKPGGAKTKEMEDEEVPETLDPSELWHIREALEKYTSELAGASKDGRSIPRLAANEADEELDSSVGRDVYLTWAPVLTKEGEKFDWVDSLEEVPFKLLSTVLPGLGIGSGNGLSLVVKNNVDGTVHALSSSISTAGEVVADPPTWKHVSTFSALSFVLASKQDTRFTHHILVPESSGSKLATKHPRSAVFAFDNGARGAGGGNVYIYRAPPSIKGINAKQCIIKLGDGFSGSLLGVGAIPSSSHEVQEGEKAMGNVVVLCLCENQLVIIRDIL